MLTEEAARKKWCPFVRVVEKYADGVTAPRNRVVVCDASNAPQQKLGAELAGACCIASECMAFLWLPDVEIWLDDLHTAVIDQADEDLAHGAWWWDGRYVKGADNDYLHRVVMKRHIGPIPDGLFVDHIDGDPLNNRLGNLRLVTPQQNAANAAPRGGKSQYRGVHQQASGRWAVQITKAGKRQCLGTYDTELEAAAVYDEMAKQLHGEFARLNLTKIENSGRRGYCGLAGKP
jgi:hypothetical protein